LVAAHALALAAQSSTWLRPAAIITYHYKVNPKNNLKRKKKQNKTPRKADEEERFILVVYSFFVFLIHNADNKISSYTIQTRAIKEKGCQGLHLDVRVVT
jgi:hypothetical protein